MADSTLAQDEIDALLNAANLSDSDDTGGEEKKELADEFASEFLNSASETFLALIGDDIAIEKIDSKAVPMDIISQEITEPVAVAFISASKGLSSVAALLFNEKKTSVATDLILMGEGAGKDKFSDDDTDALKEALNQIMGNLGQNLTGIYGESISFDQADVQILSAEDAHAAIKDKYSADSIHLAKFSLKIVDKLDSEFLMLLPLSIEDEIEAYKAKIAGSISAQSEAAGAAEPSADTGGGAFSADNLDMILDMKVEIVVKLGETIKPLKEITGLDYGHILALDKASNAPVDVIVNNSVIAKGELIVIPPYNFAIKVTEVKDKIDRIKKLSFH